MWELSGGRGRLLLGAPGGGRAVKGSGMRLSPSQFFSISRPGPRMAGGSALISHLGLVRGSPAFYFTWPGTTFGFTVQHINFHSVTSCRSGLGGGVQPCARSSSIQLTRIEPLQRTRSSSGRQKGEGQASERGKPRSEVPASPERRASRANPAPLREAGGKGSQGTQAGSSDTEAKGDPIRWFYGVF